MFLREMLPGVVPPGDVVYDIETYPNVFTLWAAHATEQDCEWYFELSSWRNDAAALAAFLHAITVAGGRMVGFNNLGFDYPVLHLAAQLGNAATAPQLYQKAMAIIGAPDNARFAHMVWERDRLVPQIDLYKIHHFDNVARSTSLKMMEFNMRSDNVEDLPIAPGTYLEPHHMPVLRQYNRHDVLETRKFYHLSRKQIAFREELTEKYGRDFMNHNDTKIGKDYFIMQLESERPGTCFTTVNGRRQPRQTVRDRIHLSDVVLPYVRFRDPEFQRIADWFRAQTITETKGVFEGVSCTVQGFQYVFGTGGIHGSVESQIVEADDTVMILDLDVASYYPNLAIANRFYPAHLGEEFCDIYLDVFNQRKQYEKNSAENAMLKLALNGVYGDSNNKYSPFYDPQYTMRITINGQLLLCMLAEALGQACDQGLRMVQINTDGLTVRMPRHLRPWVDSVCDWWQQMTKLTLESVEYRMMAVRDVNNYIAVKTDGGVKRKGAYEYEMNWHQNFSALVVPRAAEAALVYGRDITDFVKSHADYYDFMLRAKVPRSSFLEWGGERVSNIVRYYVSTEGRPLEKVMPPAGPLGAYKRKNGVSDHYYAEVLAEVGDGWDARIHTKAKTKYTERRIGIETGWTVQLCNDVRAFDAATLNYEWYIKEAQKLVLPLLRG